MRCKKNDKIVDSDWKIVNNAYVPAVTVCNNDKLYYKKIAGIPDLNFPIGIIEKVVYDDVKIKVNIYIENKDVAAQNIKIYRNTELKFRTATLIKTISTNNVLQYTDNLGEIEAGVAYFYYIIAEDANENKSKFSLIGAVSLDETAFNILSTLMSDEPESRVDESIIWPITMGVPFQKGAVVSDEDLLQAVVNHRIVPSQQKETLQWNDGSSKFITIDFQAKIQELNDYDSELSLNDGPKSHANPVVVEETEEAFSINNGVISFDISKISFKGVENFVHNGQTIINDSDFYWINDRDFAFKAENFTSPSVTVETEGDIKTVIKAEGFYKYSSTESMKFRIRLHVFAGLPYVRIDYTWIWTENTFSANICTFSTTGNKVKLSPCHNGNVSNWSNGQAVKFTPFTGSTLPTGLNTTTVYYLRSTGNESLSCNGGDPVARATFTAHATESDATNNVNIISLGTNGTGVFMVNAHTPYIKDIALKFNTAFTATETNLELDSVINSYSANTKVIQTAYDEVEILDNSDSDDVGNIAGWTEVSNGTIGLACAIRDMKYESTKQFTSSSNSLTAHIIAPDAPNFNWSWDANKQHSHVDSSAVEFAGLCPSNPCGVAKTTEIWLWPTTAATNNAGINDLVQNPPCVITDPEYNCNTDVITNTRPASETPEELQFIEDAIERTIIATYQPTTIDYKMLDYGDVHLYRSGNWRNWDSNGHGSGRASLTQFYRTGKRLYKYLGEIFHKHYVDVDVVNYSSPSPGYGGAYGTPKTMGWKHTYSSLHWSWGPIFPSFSWHLESMIWAIGMLDSERLNESMADARSWGNYLTTGGTINGPITSREQYGVIEPFVAFYMYDNNEYNLDGAFSWFDRMDQAATFTEMDLVLYNQQGQPIVPKNNFWYFYVIGLRNLYYNLTDEDKKLRIKNLILKITADYTEQKNDFNDPMYFINAYSSTYPVEIWYQMGQREMVTPYIFAYEMTGNVNYLRQSIVRVVNFALATDEGGIPVTNYEANNHTIQNMLLLLGVWANEDFRTDLWYGGNNLRTVSLATVFNSPNTYSLTYFFRKTTGQEATIRFYFANNDYANPVYYKITKPDGTTILEEMTVANEASYILPYKYELEITNEDFDGYDLPEFKLEILSRALVYPVYQTDLEKFVLYLYPQWYAASDSFPVAGAAESGHFYIKTMADQATVNITNNGGGKLILSQENIDDETDFNAVPVTTGDEIFNKTLGTESNIVVDSDKIVKVLNLEGSLVTTGFEPYASNTKEKFFIPYQNPNRYFPLLTVSANVYTDSDATIPATNGQSVAVWKEIGDSHFQWIQNVSNKKPTYVESGINGLPALDFLGSRFLNLEGSILTISEGSFFIVFKPTTLGPGNQTLFGSCYNNVSYASLNLSSDGGLQWSSNSGGGPYGRSYTNAGVITAGQTYVLTASVKEATNTCIMRLNGVQITVSGSPARFFSSHLRFALGSFIYTDSTNSRDYFNGLISEFRILNLYNLVDDPGKVLEEEQKLLDKYL